jgi:hypothetical protein
MAVSNNGGDYLPWTILVILGEYFFIVLVVALLYNLQIRMFTDYEYSTFGLYFTGPSFEKTYLSYGRFWMYVLLLLRFCAFVYFLAIAFIWNLDLEGGRNAIFFSLWHIFFIAFYFFMATIASMIGVTFEEDRRASVNALTSSMRSTRSYWSATTLGFATAIQILFEVAGGTAFFITLSVYLVLQKDFTFWNVTQHLVISLIFVVELFLNRIRIRWEHIVLNETWLLIYLIVIWPVVVRGDWPVFPYGFLNTAGQNALIFYSVGVAVSCAMYLAWWLLGAMRDLCWMLCGNPHDVAGGGGGDGDFEGIEFTRTYREPNAPPSTQNPSNAPKVY